MTSTRKAYPNLNLSELDAHMIQTFLRAMDDKIPTTTVLTNDVRNFKKVVEVATRLDLAAGNAPADAIVYKKPSVLHFQSERHRDEMDEATIARVSKLVISDLENSKAVKEKTTDRGRSRDRRRQFSSDRSTDKRDYSNQRRDYSNQRRDYTNQRRDSQGHRHDDADKNRDRSRGRCPDSGRQRSQSNGNC